MRRFVTVKSITIHIQRRQADFRPYKKLKTRLDLSLLSAHLQACQEEAE